MYLIELPFNGAAVAGVGQPDDQAFDDPIARAIHIHYSEFCA